MNLFNYKVNSRTGEFSLNDYNNPTAKWYAIQIVPSKEGPVSRAIYDLRIQFPNRIFSSLIPKETVTTNVFTRSTYTKKTMRGYVYLQACLDDLLISTIKRLPNVYGFLGTDKPSPIRQSEINTLLGL